MELLIYLILINLFAYFAIYIDKKKAINGEYRIKEKELLEIALLGGVIGAIIAMFKFHHKTKKQSFFIRMYAIAVAYLIIITVIIYNMYF